MYMIWAGWGSQSNNSTVAFKRYPIHYFGLKKKFSLWISASVLSHWIFLSDMDRGWSRAGRRIVFCFREKSRSLYSLNKQELRSYMSGGKRLNNRLSFLSTKPTRNVWREQEMYKKKKGDFSSGLLSSFWRSSIVSNIHVIHKI